MRLCKHCGGALPCKACKHAREQAWADAHRERVRAQKAAYTARYPDRDRQSKRDWYERNKASQMEKSRARKAEHRDEINARYRTQYASDPTPFLVRAKRREEREAAVGGTFTSDDKCALFQSQRGLCANPYCQADLSVTGFHADHKIPVLRGGPHDPANRQLLCPTCNHRKGTLTNEEWIQRQAMEESACA